MQITRNLPLARLNTLRRAGALFSLCLAGSLACLGQSLTVHQAIEEALDSPQAQAAAAQADEAKGQRKQAGLGINPRLFLQSEDWRPWGSDFAFTTQTEDYGFLSQTFEIGGKRHRRVELADARLEEARAQEQSQRLAITARVAAAYWNAAVLQRTVALLEEDMKVVDAMVRYHQERVDAGAMRGVDLLRMQIERDRLRVSLVSTRRDATQARLELFKAMGREPVTNPELTDPVEQLATVPIMPVQQVLDRRVDLQLAHDSVRSAQADVALQRANGVPNLDLIGGYKRNSTDNTGYGALQVDLPFRNRNQGEIERAEASLRYAQSHLQALEVQARVEIAQSEENYRREQELVTDLLPDMRAKAKQNLDLLTEAYRIGGVDLLRFLDAERTEFDVEVSALRTYADYQQAVLRLQLSYGVQP